MYRVSNNSSRDRMFRIRRGNFAILKPGETQVLDLVLPNDAYLSQWARFGVKIETVDPDPPEPHPRLADVAAEIKAGPKADEPDPRDALREEARSLEIEVDMRWGEKRLREEIDKALAE